MKSSVDFNAGDIVNGHVLGRDGQWHRIAAREPMRAPEPVTPNRRPAWLVALALVAPILGISTQAMYLWQPGRSGWRLFQLIGWAVLAGLWLAELPPWRRLVERAHAAVDPRRTRSPADSRKHPLRTTTKTVARQRIAMRPNPQGRTPKAGVGSSNLPEGTTQSRRPAAILGPLTTRRAVPIGRLSSPTRPRADPQARIHAADRGPVGVGPYEVAYTSRVSFAGE
jgi:hypothetical protein